MGRNVIKINEDTIRKIVAETIKEMGDTEDVQYLMGKIYRKKALNKDRKGSSDVADHALSSIDDEFPGDLETTKRRKLLNAFHDGMSGLEKGSHSKFMGLDKK